MARAGNLIPFFPKRIVPFETNEENSTVNNDFIDRKTVLLKREIPIHFDTNKIDQYFSFIEMKDKDGIITKEYRSILDDRVLR